MPGPKSSTIKPSTRYASLSIGIVMLLLSLALILLLHTQNLTSIIKSSLDIVVELDALEASSDVEDVLSKSEWVDITSITVIPSTEAVEIMGDIMNVSDVSEVPFKDVLTFRVQPDGYDTDYLEMLASKLSTIDEVSNVVYESLSSETVKRNLRWLAFVVLGLSALFVLLAMVIIRNTINLSMYSDRRMIKTMELVGAKWNFIKMPYIKTSVLIGLRAWVVSSVLVITLMILGWQMLPLWSEVINPIYVVLALAGALLAAVIIPAIVSNSAANRFLHASMTDLQ